MKRLLTVICLVLVCLSLSSCNPNGKTDNVVISIGKSASFSKAEIHAAANCVTGKFKDFHGCEITRLWYDEKQSNQDVKGYISYGRGSTNGATAKNVIVLLSDFKVGSSGGDGSLNPNSTYTEWTWILKRNSKTGSWQVDDWGY
jgi:hypothetical protein